MTEWPQNKMQKETKLEEFRSFRTSKRRKKRSNVVMKEKKLKLRTVLYVTKNSNEKQSNQIVSETERKHLVEFRTLKEFVAFINLHFDFS